MAKRSNDAAIIEIVEDNDIEPGRYSRGIIKPNQVRINGTPLWAPSGKPVIVHEVRLNDREAPSDEALSVTLTLWARRVFLGHAKESPETPERRVADAEERLAEAQRNLEEARREADSAVA